MNARRLTSVGIAAGIVLASLWFLVEPSRKVVKVRQLEVSVLAVAEPRKPGTEDWVAVATVRVAGEGNAKMFVRPPYPKVGTNVGATVTDYDNGERVVTLSGTGNRR